MHKRGERGITLLMGAMSLVFLIPIIGLSIDVGFVYVIKTKLQAAVDGAALAAARALVLGSDTASQAVSAQNNAVTWFYANFPTGTFGSQNVTMSQSNVQVFDDPNNPNLRNVTVSATVQAKSFFMRWLGFSVTNIGTTGNASRRDVVVMMVLDRSGSMNTAGACPSLVSSAKLFTGQFAAGRDRIGLVSFAENVRMHSAPTTNFRTVLGYQNDSGSANGAIDTITCNGNTNTAQAISVAYNELYKTNLPGALNLVMFETDGLPNSMTMNFWDSANSVAGIAAGSNCLDANGKKKSQGGFGSLAALRSWTSGQSMGAGAIYPDIPAGLVGGVQSDDPGGTPRVNVLQQYWTNTSANGFGTNAPWVTTANGCAFNTNGAAYTGALADFAWLPATDVYGNMVNPASPYKAVTMNGTHLSNIGWSNFHNAALNAADNSAYRARTNPTIPAYFFGIGLGGTSTNPPDYVLMQRIANDPGADNFNSPAKYQACPSEPGCTTYPDQPQGTFIFSTDKTVLAAAFLQISSQILRLSK